MPSLLIRRRMTTLDPQAIHMTINNQKMVQNQMLQIQRRILSQSKVYLIDFGLLLRIMKKNCSPIRCWLDKGKIKVKILRQTNGELKSIQRMPVLLFHNQSHKKNLKLITAVASSKWVLPLMIKPRTYQELALVQSIIL